MKKGLILFFVIFFAGCINKVEIKPPQLKVSPDTVQNVSPVDYASFKIEVFSEEDLKGFRITTEPWIYGFDTTFGTFMHIWKRTLSFKAPEGLRIGTDSTIKVTFEITDNENTTTIERQLKLTEGYPPMVTRINSLTYAQDSNVFYSARLLGGFNCGNRVDSYTDIILIYNQNDGFSLVSPDASYSGSNLTNTICYYNTDGKNHTKLAKTFLNESDINSKLLYNLETQDNYINDNYNNGVGITDLSANDFIVFQTSDNRKGIIKILSADHNTKKLTFKIYVQKYPAK